MEVYTEDEDVQNVEEVSAPIVDCDVLEAAKENIQPIAKGRRVTALSAILATPHAKRDGRLAATRNRLRMNVDLALENSAALDDDEEEADADADPLEAYCTLVYWVVENYPQGHSAESGLLELLEEATRVLKDHQEGKWRNDIRYLKLWVLYASYVEKPSIIFKFCLVNEIGTEHALLYEEFAVALERAHRKTEADEVYLLGIARRASPLDRLEAKYHDFQKRMMSSPVATTATAPTPATPAAQASGTPATTHRSALGDTSLTTSSRRITRSASRLIASASSFTPLTNETPVRAQPNARIQVFVDTPPTASSSRVLNTDDAPSEWSELGTRKSRIKENVKEATKAAGTTLKQSGRSVRPTGSTPKISVFVDPLPDEDVENRSTEETREMPPPPPPVATGRTAKSKGEKSIPIFRDEAPESAAQPKKSRSGKGMAIFCDVEESQPVAVASSSKPSKQKPPVKMPISVFCDDEAGASAESKPRSSSAKAKAKAKAPMMIFRDEDAGAESDHSLPQQSPALTTPDFTLFKDEETPFVASKDKAVGLGIVGLGSGAPKGPTAVKLSSEAEALRKDPLKNYPEAQKTVDMDMIL